MDLTPYVDQLRRELAVAAEAGGDDARQLAERLTGPLESAARLVLLGLLSATAAEITAELAPGSVEVRLRGLDPELVVTSPPAPTAETAAVPAPEPEPAPAERAAAPTDDAATARINLRLPESLKARVETAAATERLSVNSWLVRAATAALDTPSATARPARSLPSGGQRFTGWVR